MVLNLSVKAEEDIIATAEHGMQCSDLYRPNDIILTCLIRWI